MPGGKPLRLPAEWREGLTMDKIKLLLPMMEAASRVGKFNLVKTVQDSLESAIEKIAGKK